MTTYYYIDGNPQKITIPNNVIGMNAIIVAGGGNNNNGIGGNGAMVSLYIPLNNNDLYIKVGGLRDSSDIRLDGNTFLNCIVIAGAGGAGGNRRGGNGGYLYPNGILIDTSVDGYSFGSGYISPGYGGEDFFGSVFGESGSTIKGGNTSASGGGGGGGYGGGGGQAQYLAFPSPGGYYGNDGFNYFLENYGGPTGGSRGGGINKNGFGGARPVPQLFGGSGFCGGGAGAGGSGGGSSFSKYKATFTSANNSNQSGYITINWIYKTYINSILDWNNCIGNQYGSYILEDNLVFENSFPGYIFLNFDSYFDGNGKSIILKNIQNFSGLFDLSQSNQETIIRNLKVKLSNSNLQDNNGFLGNGINSNGLIENCFIYLDNNILGNNCGGLVTSANQLTVNNCMVKGIIQGIDSGGLVGSNCANVTINNSRVVGNVIDLTAGGLVGNNTTINDFQNSFFVRPYNNNNGLIASNVTINNSYNIYSVYTVDEE